MRTRTEVCVWLLVCVLSAALAVSADVSADPVEEKYQLTVSGTVRTFYVYVPSSYTGATPFPLLVFFHGATDSCQSSTNFMIAGFTMEQVARKYLLATPCGINKVWSNTVDTQFAQQLLDFMADNYEVDPQRLYSSGFSNGAFLTNYMGCHIPQRWTGGLAYAAGTLMGGGTNQTNAQLLQDCDTNFAQAKTTVNVLKLQGSKDPGVQPYGATGIVGSRDDFYGWALRNGCKGSPTTTHEDSFYKDEHFENCPQNVFVRLVMLYGIPHQWVQNATFNYNTVILDQFGIRTPATPLTRVSPPPHHSRIARRHV